MKNIENSMRNASRSCTYDDTYNAVAACCNHNCNEGRACPLRTSNGGESVDCVSTSKIESAAGVVLAVITGLFLAVALMSWWSS